MGVLALLDALLAKGHALLQPYVAAHGPLTVFICGMMFAHESVFQVTNLGFFLVARIPALQRYKIQDGKADPSAQQVWHAIKHVYFGRFVFQLPATVGYYYIWQACGGSMTAPPPPASTALLQLLVMGVMMEVLFYSMHRAFHSRWLYRFHKRHHEFRAPVGVSSEYASPVEDLVVNLPSTLLPGVFLGAHPLVLWLWLMIRVWETVDVHSGYALPISPFHLIFEGPERHDFHHSHHTKGCFGSFGFMDRIIGTDAEFRKWKAARAQERQVAASDKAGVSTKSKGA